ncbi:Uu.00g141190.m01.CDS01 [Anthostomella pinea]|uniref:Uu.00g141190.m01.CDS01 n=1 Tax=Anthostomella pinea TaxID=933095 RepID=A0AAI8YLB9_9PEZI|nr:Uu.00g141190.m01.CDS01 [Anthostomella pinea]
MEGPADSRGPGPQYVLDDHYCEVCKVFKLHQTEEETGVLSDAEYDGAAMCDIAEQAGLGCKTCGLVHDAVEKIFGMRGWDVPSSNGPNGWATLRRDYYYMDPLSLGVYFTISPGEYDPGKLDDECCLSTVRSWMQGCDNKHPRCAPNASNGLPKRLLDLANDGSHLSVRLHATTPNESFEYVTLSHCWGDAAKVPKTTQATLESYQQQVPGEMLTPTFRDAIWIVRQLGFRYLWIDALCIVQDEPTDWAATAGTMATIYGEASLNIAAASSENGNGGCFYERMYMGHWFSRTSGRDVTLRTDLVPECGLFVRLGIDHSFVEGLTGIPTMDTGCPLSERKWFYQERILSRRTLFYTRGT